MEPIFKSIKIIKKTRTPKTCRGCSKPIKVGSICLQTFEFLQVSFATDYFHTQTCVLKGVKGFVKKIGETKSFLKKLGIKNIQIGKKSILYE